MTAPVKWDDDNPWLAHFLATLDCRCTRCGLLADTADLYDHYQKKGRRDFPESLYRFCVRASDRVAAQGWTIVDGLAPHCPECSANPANITPPLSQDATDNFDV